MCRIEYVSYRQGPNQIRIVSAADRIVPVLVLASILEKRTLLSRVTFLWSQGWKRNIPKVYEIIRKITSFLSS